jgi:hypothetical protein
MNVKDFLARHSLKTYFICFSVLYLFQSQQVIKQYNRSDKVINEDALGYHLILPAYFKYHDPNFKFKDSVYKNELPPVINVLENGQTVCKYFPGTAVLQSPFYGIALLFNLDSEGDFSLPMHKMILWASQFYLLMGFVFFYLILKQINVRNHWIFFASVLCLFGSNLFVYASYDAAYSHVYSFFAFLGFTYFLLKIPNNKNALYFSGLFYGIILIIRPVNGLIILLIPVILQSNNRDLVFKFSNIFKFLIACLLPLTLMSYLWYWQTGDWIVYSYTGEQLDLSHPQIIDFLFSYNCGWVVYTPLPLIAFVVSMGILIYKKKYQLALGSTLILFLIIYVLSSWYYLHYGCTAGCRPITEYYGLIFILFVYAVQMVNQSIWGNIVIQLGCFILLIYNQIVIKQFFNQIINWCSMDKERFEMVFLQTHEVYHYACHNFWDFNKYKKTQPLEQFSVNKSLKTNSSSPIAKASISMPNIETNDSDLLVTIKMNAKILEAKNTSYLRMLILNEGKYVEQQTLLLRRKFDTVCKEEEFDILIHKELKNATLEMTLESVDGSSSAEIEDLQILIRRIKNNS